MEKKRSLYIFLITVLLMSSPFWIGMGVWLVILQGKASILIGGIVLITGGIAGLAVGIFFWVKLHQLNKRIKENGSPQAGTILPADAAVPSADSSCAPVPAGVKVAERTGERIIDYAPPRTIWAWFGIGLALLLILNAAVDSYLGRNQIASILSFVGGPALIYLCLVSLMNHHVIRVTSREIRSGFGPVPLTRRRQISLAEIKQLHLKEETYYGKMGEVTTYLLLVIRRDGGQVKLIRGLPFAVGDFLVKRIENWLGISHKYVRGEAQ